MNPTSHFIAISLKTEPLSNLFVDLFKLLNSSNSVIFQNPNSAHITLYYLPQKINQPLIQPHIPDITNPIQLTSIGYFQKQKEDYVCYLTSPSLDSLEKHFQKLKTSLPNQVPENHLTFTPHMTLFKITNPQKFKSYKAKVKKIIQNHLTDLSKINLNNGTHLYKVNSNFTPELQVKCELTCVHAKNHLQTNHNPLD
jgi:2'-5' RNA ligase